MHKISCRIQVQTDYLKRVNLQLFIFFSSFYYPPGFLIFKITTKFYNHYVS